MDSSAENRLETSFHDLLSQDHSVSPQSSTLSPAQSSAVLSLSSLSSVPSEGWASTSVWPLHKKRVTIDYSFRPRFYLPRNAPLPSYLANRLSPLAQAVLSRPTTFSKVATSSSVGRKHCLSVEEQCVLGHFIQEMLKTGIISQARRNSFLSYPFFVPKNNGEPRLIIDYGHLKPHVRAPYFRLPSFLAFLRRSSLLTAGDWMVRIDLRHAFYSVPLPESFRSFTSFRAGNKTYRFNVLPMGLYISPFILQHILNACLATVREISGVHTWGHIDDILLWHSSKATLHSGLVTLFRSLHDAGFYIALAKSVLIPTQYINFLGFILNTRDHVFNCQSPFLLKLKELLQSKPRSAREEKRLAGTLAFALYAMGLTSGYRFAARSVKGRRFLWRLLRSGP